MADPLDNDFINKLLTAPQKAPRAGRPRANDLTRIESRTYTNWFTLRHSLSVCGNPDCTDTRPLRTKDGNAMCTDVNGTMVCRICFLDGYGVVVA